MPNSPYKAYREKYCEACEDHACKESPGVYTRIELIAKDMFPGICHDFREDIWNYQEAQTKLSHYREVGVTLAQRFDDNVDSLERLNAAYGTSTDCLEALRERQEMEKLMSEA